MITLLPSRSPRLYRGKYPTRVHSFGGRRGVYHFELNDGRRYVVTGDELKPGFVHIEGLEFIACLKPGATKYGTDEMSLADYAGIILVTRLLRVLSDRHARRTLPAGFIASGEF